MGRAEVTGGAGAQATPGGQADDDSDRNARPVGIGDTRVMFRIELPVVLVVMFGVLFLASWPPVQRALPVTESYLLLGIVAAGAAASASLVAMLTGRLLDDRVLLGLATALAFYGMVVMPLSVGRLSTGPDWVRAALFGAAFSFLGLMAVALFASRRATYSHALLAAIALAGTAVVGMFGQLYPGFAAMLTDSPVPAALVFAGWCGLSVVLIAHGVSHAHAVTWRVGLGFGVIAVAHLLRAASSPHTSVPSVAFFALRALGLVVLLIGLALYARESAQRVRTEQEAEYRRLRDAAFAAEQAAEVAAERDHEMRNMIAGISGATQLLGNARRPADGDSGADPANQLGAAVCTELDRLRDLLERPAQSATESATPVATLLTRLVMLQRAAGATIDIEVPASMRLAMPAAPLAQVVTNLLVNCARYAPGAPITITAGARAGVGWIDVTDAGPGLRPSADPKAGGGSGLGLTVSNRLLAAYDGTLELAQNSHGPGCTATVRVPLAATGILAESAQSGGTLMVGTL